MNNQCEQAGDVREHDEIAWIRADQNGVQEQCSDEKISGEIILQDIVGIADIKLMQDHFVKVLQANVEICIHSESLKQIDTAGIQLIHAFVQSASQQSTPLHWQSISTVLRNNAELLGVHKGMRFE